MNKHINESVEKVLLYKGKLIRHSRGYKQYIKKILNDQGINCNDETVEAFVMGAVDGMIYDIACSLDFTKQKGKVNDWSSYRKRREILNKVWSKVWSVE